MQNFLNGESLEFFKDLRNNQNVINDTYAVGATVALLSFILSEKITLLDYDIVTNLDIALVGKLCTGKTSTLRLIRQLLYKHGFYNSDYTIPRESKKNTINSFFYSCVLGLDCKDLKRFKYFKREKEYIKRFCSANPVVSSDYDNSIEERILCFASNELGRYNQERLNGLDCKSNEFIYELKKVEPFYQKIDNGISSYNYPLFVIKLAMIRAFIAGGNKELVTIEDINKAQELFELCKQSTSNL